MSFLYGVLGVIAVQVLFAGGFLLAFTTIAIPRVVNKELKKNAGK